MADLELNFLGDLEVIRDGSSLPLPPSRKTRALLAYLALHERPLRREHLCELLWEIPDDPRGSLRWSLSKLRRLVDDDSHTRIVADRSSVSFAAEGAVIDVAALHQLAGQPLNGVAIETLEAAASRYRGNFLEGLEFSSFHDFHAWCMAEREQAARDQGRILRSLVDRLADDPARALPHARSLATLLPYDESARAALIRILMALHHLDEAEQQYRLGKRMLDEVGVTSSGALYAAWRGVPGTSGPPATAVPAQLNTVRGADALVGRDAEMAQLTGALDDVVASGQAQVLLIRGEPGMGKTRLLEAALAVAGDRGADVLQAGAFESETMRPFALWVDALGDGFGAAERDNREALFNSLGDMVARRCESRPLVLAFDDLQWCDESSAAALHYVARTNRQRPLLCMLTAREGELRDNGPAQQALRSIRRDGRLRELKLEPLAATSVQALIELCAPCTDSEALSRQCAGNPLLAIELARAETAGDSGDSLDELIRERLTRFDIDGAEVLRWASVLAPHIDIAGLVRVSGMDASQVGEALDLAERQSMLVATERGFRFSHDLIARAVYADIAPTRRRVMHRRLAELLEQDTAVDLARAADLAHHAAQSGDPALAARAMVSAGRLCLRFFANDDALNLAHKGLQLAEQLADADRVCLQIDLHDVILDAAPLDDWQGAAEQYVALAEQALDHGALAHARLGYQMASYVRWVHGQWSGAREETLQAERVTRGATNREHIVGLAETAKCLAMLERDLSQADALLMEAQALAGRENMRHLAIPMASGMLRYHEGRLDEAEELFKEARTLCKAAGDRVSEFQAHEYLVMIDLQRGAFHAARERCAALLEIGQRLREGSEAPFARALEGLCRYALSDDPQTLDDALAELREVDAKYRLAYTLTRAAQIDIDRQRYSSAVNRAEEALTAAQILERATEMLLAHRALAEAHLALGDKTAHSRHAQAMADLEGAPVARWARDDGTTPVTSPAHTAASAAAP